MLLDKIYADFVAHTNLTDSIYKAVFVNISEILNKINSINLISLTYTDSDDRKSTFYEFEEIDKIPRYIVELFQNIFKNYYTLPESSTVSLIVTYKDVEYEIINKGMETTIPEGVKFLKSLELFNWFILDKPVIDLFGEFDKVFNFMNSFKSPITNVFEPLKKKLEKTEATEHIMDNAVSKNTVADTELSVESLQNKIKDVLASVDSLRIKRDQLQINKNNLISKINSREALLADQEKLTVEYQTLKEVQEDYLHKIDQMSIVVVEIEAALVDLNQKNTKEESYSKDIELYIEKKIIFEKEIESRRVSVKDFDGMLKNFSDRIKSITNDLSEIENYTTNDIDTLGSNIKALNTEQEDLYSILLGLEGELKHQKSLLNTNALRLEKASTDSMYTGVAIKSIETVAITSHLALAQQPTSVITVLNYLRYYFTYYSTVITKGFLDNYSGLDTYLAQAVASKVVLLRYFGMYFHTMLSAIDFADNRIGKVINIVQD